MKSEEHNQQQLEQQEFLLAQAKRRLEEEREWLEFTIEDHALELARCDKRIKKAELKLKELEGYVEWKTKQKT